MKNNLIRAMLLSKLAEEESKKAGVIVPATEEEVLNNFKVLLEEGTSSDGSVYYFIRTHYYRLMFQVFYPEYAIEVEKPYIAGGLCSVKAKAFDNLGNIVAVATKNYKVPEGATLDTNLLLFTQQVSARAEKQVYLNLGIGLDLLDVSAQTAGDEYGEYDFSFVKNGDFKPLSEEEKKVVEMAVKKASKKQTATVVETPKVLTTESISVVSPFINNVTSERKTEIVNEEVPAPVEVKPVNPLTDLKDTVIKGCVHEFLNGKTFEDAKNGNMLPLLALGLMNTNPDLKDTLEEYLESEFKVNKDLETTFKASMPAVYVSPKLGINVA